MRQVSVRILLPLVVVATLTGCTGAGSTARSSPASRSAPASVPSRSLTAHPGDHQGSLTPEERSLATAIAKRQQSKVIGTFIGATAFVTQGTPFDPDSDCDVDKRFINIRLVWKADANFTHGGVPGGPPDGPRKDLLMTVDQRTHDICEIGAGYRNVGAAAGEALLYGEWPSKADG